MVTSLTRMITRRICPVNMITAESQGLFILGKCHFGGTKNLKSIVQVVLPLLYSSPPAPQNDMVGGHCVASGRQ